MHAGSCTKIIGDMSHARHNVDRIAARVLECINLIIDTLLKQSTFLLVVNDGMRNHDGPDVRLAAVNIQRQMLKRRKRKPG